MQRSLLTRSNRKKFSKEEDAKLKTLVETFGDHDWDTITNQMNGRTKRECRGRYINYLSPNIKNSQSMNLDMFALHVDKMINNVQMLRQSNKKIENAKSEQLIITQKSSADLVSFANQKKTNSSNSFRTRNIGFSTRNSSSAIVDDDQTTMFSIDETDLLDNTNSIILPNIECDI